MTALMPLAAIEANAVRLIDLVQALHPAAPPARRTPPPLTLIEPLPRPTRAELDRLVLQPPRGLVTYLTLDGLADRVAQLLDGRGYDLVHGYASFAHTNTFPKVSVYAAAPLKADQQWLCAAVLLGPDRAADLDALEMAIGNAMRRRG